MIQDMLLYCLFLVLVVLGTLGVFKGARFLSDRMQMLKVQLREEQKSSRFRVAYSNGYMGRYDGYYIYDDQGAIRMNNSSFTYELDPAKRTYFSSELQARKQIRKILNTQAHMHLILNG